LASNSLLEGVVFAERIALGLADGLPPRGDPQAPPGVQESTLRAEDRVMIQQAMTQGVGVLRSRESVAGALATVLSQPEGGLADLCTQAWETTNVATAAAAIALAAGVRKRPEVRTGGRDPERRR
jgi:aspartate oxidase